MGLSSSRVNGVRSVVNASAPNPEQESIGIRSDWIAETAGVVANPAGLPSSGNWVGRRRWVTSESAWATWTGSMWMLRHGAYAEAAGIATYASAIAPGAGSSPNLSITFPAGRFTQPPIVTFSITATQLNAAFNGPITTSGFGVRLYNWSTVSSTAGTQVHWHAVQMSSTSAAG